MGQDWPGIQSIIGVERTRTKGQKISIDTDYYLSSSRDNTFISRAIRQHWILDVVFKEDGCQIHEALSAQHMALFRRVVRNMVKQHTKSNGSIRSKLVAASFDDDFRAELLFWLTGINKVCSRPVPCFSFGFYK
ncbi:hypothetical protein CWB96_13970 [Pseudoalteromonas citrea]|uniref:Transposase IS4-like domain-containing protein n=1 Tax=Pseudoalteromonas citrea TaxID=43655 RepID=A0A5S3XPC0_9GAMM|nr:hypothetical protein CWB97_21295 [Pseudoalteromonas citrea]TMP57110.1 hypothetical protein CWB96_13970 [Pseudoalteromonas citrea]